MTENSQTVTDIYAAFGRGDVSYILDQLSDSIRWDHGVRETDLPYLRAGTGKQAVIAFFTALAENVEFTTFEPGPPCVSDDTVIVAVREIGRNLITGTAIEDDIAVHIWTFGPDGKVVEFRHVLDVARHEAAARPVVTPASSRS